ncbi:hypothetical protein [Sorangium sp. So ce233]
MIANDTLENGGTIQLGIDVSEVNEFPQAVRGAGQGRSRNPV